ncbi:low molecular weight phosphotyrosine protein phosphatase, putative [Trichomonas vaginalis G3]|uniref:Low molecular weight phosphotyrosine protein phosphatase, putative n=1 Tax=Trichomonas vaginalis (strain ATCC PRA-98 / G3) TaxID=412133 RepID=A2G0H1_TRIV3|nr:non-membrane spanning protein tyrosine phosphatase protein [Trichomonas vaginalis G3]EAX89346.1 low molecular weight phosphotyrosine protein phosphatase, putative [Trichomonas vaginalis G3]KAI5553674.1 non-membrane spanning protein tyrosine phosphatase protein [Trichomonas vaginalis G3]|eukprot:XP_001302276.1 low molecular weight phosphotyrosine protein phosphatase [Trichomonas vaginalis G3]
MSTSPPRVLFVCLGNIIRSPLCEGYLRHKFVNKVIVDSAACTHDDLGQHPDKYSCKIAREQGFDISSHISKLIKKTDFYDFDIIVSLEKYVQRSLERKKPNDAKCKIVEFAPGVDIINPWCGGLEEFRDMNTQIQKYFPAFIENNLPQLLQ